MIRTDKRKSKIKIEDNKKKKNPNKKPSTKPFDFIGEIFKTPYYIRGGDRKFKGGLMIKPKLAKKGF